MSIKDFFSKEAVAFPSGRKAPEQKGTSCYNRAFTKMGMIIAGVAMVSSFTACGPTAEQQAEMAAVPDSRKAELYGEYDTKLLGKIDSLNAAGTNIKHAIRDGLSLTWEEASKGMRKDGEKLTGEELIVEQHADSCRKASRKFINTGRTGTYKYLPEFRENLAKKVKEFKESQPVIDSIALAKTDSLVASGKELGPALKEAKEAAYKEYKEKKPVQDQDKASREAYEALQKRVAAERQR